MLCQLSYKGIFVFLIHQAKCNALSEYVVIRSGDRRFTQLPTSNPRCCQGSQLTRNLHAKDVPCKAGFLPKSIYPRQFDLTGTNADACGSGTAKEIMNVSYKKPRKGARGFAFCSRAMENIPQVNSAALACYLGDCKHSARIFGQAASIPCPLELMANGKYFLGIRTLW